MIEPGLVRWDSKMIRLQKLPCDCFQLLNNCSFCPHLEKCVQMLSVVSDLEKTKSFIQLINPLTTIFTLILTFSKQKAIGPNRHLSHHLPISDLSKWPCPLSTQKRITTNFNRDLISTFWSSFFAVDQSEPYTSGLVCLRVMPKMQTSCDLQYIAPGDKGG